MYDNNTHFRKRISNTYLERGLSNDSLNEYYCKLKTKPWPVTVVPVTVVPVALVFVVPVTVVPVTVVPVAVTVVPGQGLILKSREPGL